jgi:hypothetical protein
MENSWHDFCPALEESAMVSLTPVVASPYRVLRRSKEPRRAMTASLATPRADLVAARAVPGAPRAGSCVPPCATQHQINARRRPIPAPAATATTGRRAGVPRAQHLPRARIA